MWAFRQSDLVLVEMSRLLSLVSKFAVYVQALREREGGPEVFCFATAETLLLLLSLVAQPQSPLRCIHQEPLFELHRKQSEAQRSAVGQKVSGRRRADRRVFLSGDSVSGGPGSRTRMVRATLEKSSLRPCALWSRINSWPGPRSPADAALVSPSSSWPPLARLWWLGAAPPRHSMQCPRRSTMPDEVGKSRGCRGGPTTSQEVVTEHASHRSKRDAWFTRCSRAKFS